MLLKISRFARTIVASLLFAVSIACAAPDPARFDPLLGTDWYGIYMGENAKIGYMKVSLEKTDSSNGSAELVGGWKMQSQMTLAMKMGAVNATMTSDDTRIFKSPDGGLYSSSFVISSPNGEISVDGTTQKGTYVLTSNIGGQITRKEFPAPMDFLDSLLCTELKVVSGKLAVSDSFIFSSFEPTPPITGPVHQQVKILGLEKYLFNGVPVDVYLIRTDIKELGISADGKIDRYGDMLEGSLGGGMVMRLEGETLAKQIDKAYDVIGDNLVIPNKEIRTPEKLAKLKLRISGVDSSLALQTSMQKIQTVGDGLLVDISRQTTPEHTAPISDLKSGFESDLQSDPLIQSDDPQIKDLARNIVGDEKDSWQAAVKINNWVYENIDKRYTPDFSNALQTLNSRSGDCGEHTVLAVALLRAAGIPARPIAGLVYSSQFKGFGYHAWPEVYIGHWVQMDPTWGESLANPTHIALARGDIISQAAVLIRVMGNIKVDILETE